jgi:hypothetical protein
MDAVQIEKKTKQPIKGSGYASLRVKKDTRKRVVQELTKINKKEFGRKIRMDDYVTFALTLVTSEHHVALQEASLSHGDRFERDYKNHVTQNGMITKDEYLGKRLNGESTSPSLLQHTHEGRE